MWSGSLPERWPEVYPNMRFMSIARCQMNATLPASWARFKKLETLFLYTNEGLHGPLPAAWGEPGSLPLLQILSVAGSELTGDCPCRSRAAGLWGTEQLMLGAWAGRSCRSPWSLRSMAPMCTADAAGHMVGMALQPCCALSHGCPGHAQASPAVRGSRCACRRHPRELGPARRRHGPPHAAGSQRQQLHRPASRQPQQVLLAQPGTGTAMIHFSCHAHKADPGRLAPA